MAGENLHWQHCWGIKLPTTQYANSAWVVSTPIDTTTDNTTNLNSPGVGAPGEQANLKIGGGAALQSPSFEGGAVTQGWLVFRWFNSGTPSNSALTSIMRLRDLNTDRIILRAAANTNPSALNLLVNGTLVGTSSGTHGAVAEQFAIDFDFTGSPPQAGLVVEGVREITRASGTAGGTSVDRILMQSGAVTTTHFGYIGDITVWSSLADWDTHLTQLPNVWLAYLAPDAVSGDAGWTPSSGTNLSVLNDHNAATYTQSATDPDSITVGFQATTDLLLGWLPTTIYGAAVVTYSMAEVITGLSSQFSDGAGVVVTQPDTSNLTGQFSVAVSNRNSVGGLWDVADINSASALLSVSS